MSFEEKGSQMSGQLWATNSLGGFMYSDELSNVLRRQAQPLSKFRQFQDAKDFLDKGLQRGNLFTWDVYSNIATQGTVLTETNTMPESNFTITQGTGTVVEQGNSINFSRLIQGVFAFLTSLFSRPTYQF